MKKLLLHVLVIPLIFTACETSSDSNKTASKLGFKNPKALFLSPRNASTKAETVSKPDTLFQLLPNGSIEKVAAYDSEGNELAVRIDDIQKITNDYVTIRMIIEKGENGKDSIPYGLLVEISSGKVYDLTKYAITASTSTIMKAPVVWNGNIYTTGSEFTNEGRQTLYRINMKTLIAEPMNMQSEFPVHNFAHISNGDFLFSEWDGSNPPLQILFSDDSILPADAKPEGVNLDTSWFYNLYISADDSSLCDFQTVKEVNNLKITYRTFSASTDGLKELFTEEIYNKNGDHDKQITFSKGENKYNYLYVFKHGYLEITDTKLKSIEYTFTEKDIDKLFSEDVTGIIERGKRLFWISGGNIKYFDLKKAAPEIETVADISGIIRIQMVGDYLICTKIISATQKQTWRIDLIAQNPTSSLFSESKMEIEKIVEFSL